MSEKSTRRGSVQEAVPTSAYAIVIHPDVVRLERLLPGPMERIWSYLTESALRGKWLAAGEMQPDVDGRVELQFDYPRLSSGCEQAPAKYREVEICDLVGVVLRWEPPRELACTWGEFWGGKSEVIFRLTPQDQEVLLELAHSGLSPDSDVVAVAAGWHAHTDILIDLLAGRSPVSFWGAFARLEAEYQRRFSE